MNEREKKIAYLLKKYPEIDKQTATELVDKQTQMMSYAMMSNEERCDIIDSGCFNSIITGYGIILLDRLGLSDKVKRGATSRTMSEIFDTVSAIEAQKKYNKD